MDIPKRKENELIYRKLGQNMPTKIGFWNVEHWSKNSLEIAQKAEAKAAMEEERLTGQITQRGSSGELTRAVTRAQVIGKIRVKAPEPVVRVEPYSIPKPLSRDERREATALSAVQQARKIAQQTLRKFTLAQDMIFSTDQLFYCEVECDHPNAQSSKADGTTTPHLLCYASYENKISSVLNYTTLWPASFNPDRVPLYRDIRGTSPGSPPVRCYYWHAPSGNNGQIVAEAYAHLNTLGTPFVLFGDLNAEPEQLINKGIPKNNIVAPDGPTRISGRTLDYAVTNVPKRIAIRKYRDCPALDIKLLGGSDHAFMFLDLT